MRGLLFCLIASFLYVYAFAQEPKEITNSIGMRLVLIPKGTFTMGSPENEKGRDENEAQHEVTISRDYYLGIHEVTQSQYEKVMGENPSFFQHAAETLDHPVETVTWFDAVKFCKRLSELPEEKMAGRVYRLPTEAEWEYACRAGSKSAFPLEDEDDLGFLALYGWFKGNSSGQTHGVCQKKPNSWDLYDMHGNVWEWCSDRYGEYPEGPVIDPVGPDEGSRRVVRGGFWDCDAQYCRSAQRFKRIPSIPPDSYIGFRVALSSSGNTK